MKSGKCDRVGCYLNALKKFLADQQSDRAMNTAVRLACEAGRKFEDDLARVRRGEKPEDVVCGASAATPIRISTQVDGHWEGATFVITNRVRTDTY